MILLDQDIQDPTMIGVEGLKGLQSVAQQNQSKSIYIPSIEEAKQMNMLGRDLRSGLEGVQTPQGFGKSVYDQKVSNLTEVQNLQDFRANEQPGMLKLLNGIGKGIALAGTTFLDGTVGLVAGIANIPDKGLAGLWDNNVSNALNNLNKKMEEWLPNYRTVEEEQSPWYENLGTMNFWADSFIKNLGFTVGAYYSGAAWTKALKAAGALKGALSSEVVGSLTSAINEGRIEATNNVGDWKQLQAQQIADARDKALSQLLPDSPLYAANVALINQSYDKQMKELDERASSMGNGILLANTMLLFYNNFKTYGKLYAQGFKNAERKLLSDRVVKDGTNYVWNDVTKKRAIANGLRTGVREGIEEMNQALISESAGYMQTPDSPDAYYKAMIDPDADLQTSQFFDAVTRGFVNTYGNGQKWEEGVIGALTGLLGMPTFGRINNSGTETYLGKNKWIGLSGGLFGEFKSADFANAEGSEAVRIMNNYAEKIRDQKGHFVQGQSFANAMDGWSAENNAFEYKNAEDNDDFAAISAYAKVERLSDLKDLVNQDFENISDDQLVEIANFTSESQTDPTKPVYGGWRNSDGSLMSDTKEGRQRMREKLAKQRDSILKNIDAYEESVETVRAITNNAQQISEDQINELAWLHWKIGRFKDRFNELKEENAPLFKAYLDGIHEYINALDEAESEEAAIHEVFVREDPEYYTHDKDYEEGLKETNKVRKALTNMASFIDKLQTTNEPLSLALLMSDKEFKKYVGKIFSEQNFDFFTMLGNGSLPYAQANKLFNDLQDLSKMVTASEQFNERYKEFVNNPGAILENRQKIEKAVSQTKADTEAAEMDTRLLDDLEGTVEEVGLQTVLDTYEAASEISPERQKLIDDAEAFSKAKEDLANVKERVMRALNDIDATQQVKNDVRTLINIAGSRDEIFAIDNVLYTDIDRSPLYNETDFQGMSNAEIRSRIEERLTNVREAISKVESLIDTDDNIMGDIDQNLLSNAEAQTVEMTGNDETAKVPDVDAFEEGSAPNVSVPEQDLNYFTALLETSTPDNVQKLSSVINTVNSQINSGKKVSDILETLKASKDYKALADKYPIDDIITQYAIDKTSVTVDSNPLTVSGEDLTHRVLDKKIEDSNDSELSQNKAGEVKQYWSPIQGMLPIHTNMATVPETRYYQIVKNSVVDEYNEAQRKYIVAVGEYLEKKGAWQRVDKGQIQPGDEIHFATDPKLNTDAGAFIILITDKEGNILGNLPVMELDKTAPSYEGLAQFALKFQTEYESEDRGDSVWEMPNAVSHVDKWMIGKILFDENKHSIQDLFTTTNSTGEQTFVEPVFAIGAVNKAGQIRIVRDSKRRQDTVEDISVLTPITPINGQPYILYPTGKTSGNRQFVSVPVTMSSVTTENTPLNAEIRRRLNGILSMHYKSTPTQIGKAKIALQEVVGAKFAIQIVPSTIGENGEEKFANRVKISIKRNSGDAWNTIIDSRIEGGNASQLVETCMSYFADNGIPYQMALKYINGEINSTRYNILIAPYVRVNVKTGVTQTLSNWFTINPLITDDAGNLKEVAAKSPKSTGRKPKTSAPSTPTAALFSFDYNGNKMSIDISDWNTLYIQGKKDKYIVRLPNGKLNKKSALAAAYAYGLNKNQDMSKPYRTQWGIYNPVTRGFIIQEEFDSIINPTPVTTDNSNLPDTEELLTERARDLGVLTEKLDESIWGLLSVDNMKVVLSDDDPVDAMSSLRVAFNPRSKRFWEIVPGSAKEIAENLKHRYEPFRMVDDSDYQKWNKESEIKWLGKVLPQFVEEDRVRLVDSLIKVSNQSNPEYAWGKFSNGLIYISEGASKGTMYHEAFHAVTHTLLTNKELEDMFKAAESKYGKMSSLGIEENLAEDFRRYMQYEEDPNVSTLTKWFRKLKHFIQTLVGNERYLNKLFYSIARGNYSNRKVQSADINYIPSLLKYYLNKTTYDNLSQEDKDVVNSKGLTKEEFNELSLTEREHMLYCG